MMLLVKKLLKFIKLQIINYDQIYMYVNFNDILFI